jgi:hypothetical protein
VRGQATDPANLCGPTLGCSETWTSEQKPLLLWSEAMVYSLDKHIGRPESCICAVYGIVISGRLGLLDLVESHSPIHHVLNAVANDDDHLLVDDYVGLIAKSAMPWDHDRAALLLLGGVRDPIDKPV